MTITTQTLPLIPKVCTVTEKVFVGSFIQYYRARAREDRKKQRQEARLKATRPKIPQTPEERKRSQRAYKKDSVMLNSKLKSIFGHIHDGLTRSSRILLVNVVLSVPTDEEVDFLIRDYGLALGPLHRAHIKSLAHNNKAMQIFKHRLDHMFSREDVSTRKKGKRVYPPRVFIAWSREYGTKKGCRHYHVLIGMSGHRVHKAGAYHCQINPFGPLSQRIAHCWLETFWLDQIEFANRKRTQKSPFSSLVYYPGNKGKRITKNDIFKEIRIGRQISKKGLNWIYKVVHYMLKKETKAIPNKLKGKVKETERTFGCSRRFVL